MSWVRLSILAAGVIAVLSGLFWSDMDISIAAFVIGAALVLVFAITNFGEEGSTVDVRARDALASLKRSQHPGAVEFLLQALQHKRDSWVRMEAIEGLRKAGNPRTLPYLLPVLKDEEGDVRLAAISAIRSLADPVAKDAATAELVARSCIGALEDQYGEVRYAAVEALGAVGAYLKQAERAKVLRALSQFVDRSPDQARREGRGNGELARVLARRSFASAIAAVRKIGDPAGAEVLTQIKRRLADTDFMEEKMAVNQALIKVRVKGWMKA